MNQGTTRDRHYARAESNARAFWLVDHRRPSRRFVASRWTSKSASRCSQAIDEADLMLLTVWMREVGVHPS